MLRSLVFVYRNGCEACEAAEPELEKFLSAHPNLPTIRISADGPFVRSMLHMKQVNVTPLYVFRINGATFTKPGAMKMKDIERWIDEIESDDGERE